MKRSIYKYFYIFFFFLIISILMPISGDDWNNYLVGSEGVRHMIGQAIGMYFDWEGRFVSRLLINFLTYNKLIFDILISILITLGIYLIEHFFEIKNKKIFFLLTFLVFLLLDNYVFTQTILWVAGSITYMFPTLLIIGYIFICFKYIDINSCYSKWVYVILGIFSFFITMFVENIAFAFVAFNLIMIIYDYICYKKVNKLLLVNFIFSCLGAILMLFSPGSQNRSYLENIEFANLSFFYKCIYNYGNFIYYTISSNIYLIILMMVSAVCLSFKIYKSKVIKILSILTITLYPIIHIFIYIFGYYQPNYFTNIYWLFYLVYILGITIYYYKNDKSKLKLYLLLMLTALSSNIVMLITPAYSSRTTLFCVVLLSIIYLYVLDDLFLAKIKKWIYQVFIFTVVFICFGYLVAYINLYRFNLFLEDSIDSQLELNNQEIIIYDSPAYLSWGLTPTGDYHTRTFKMYYGIPNDKNILYKHSVWKYYIFFDREATEKNQ